MTPNTKLFTTPQAAKYLNRSYGALKAAISKGKLVGTKVSYNVRVFTQEELDDYAKRWPLGARSEVK